MFELEKEFVPYRRNNFRNVLGSRFELTKIDTGSPLLAESFDDRMYVRIIMTVLTAIMVNYLTTESFTCHWYSSRIKPRVHNSLWLFFNRFLRGYEFVWGSTVSRHCLLETVVHHGWTRGRSAFVFRINKKKKNKKKKWCLWKKSNNTYLRTFDFNFISIISRFEYHLFSIILSEMRLMLDLRNKSSLRYFNLRVKKIRRILCFIFDRR